MAFLCQKATSVRLFKDLQESCEIMWEACEATQIVWLFLCNKLNLMQKIKYKREGLNLQSFHRAVTLISQAPQSHAAGLCPFYPELYTSMTTLHLWLGAPEGATSFLSEHKLAQSEGSALWQKHPKACAPMTVCDIRSDSFSITTSTTAWCEGFCLCQHKTTIAPREEKSDL